MAGGVTSALCYLALILHLVLLTECNYGVRYGDNAKRLHIAEESEPRHRKPLVINRRHVEANNDDGETSFKRVRRDVPPDLHPNNNPNITTKVRVCVCVYVCVMCASMRRNCDYAPSQSSASWTASLS